MIEGGGLGVFKPEDVGPGRRAVGQRRDRRAGRRRSRRPSRAARQYLSYFQGALAGVDVRRPARAAPCRAREPRCASTTCARVLAPAGRQRLAARAARRLRRRHGHRAGAHRRPAGRRARQQPARTSAARSTPRRPTRPRASCSCATRIGLPLVSCATRRASWSAPTSRRTAQVRHASRMFVDGRRACACRSSPSCCARATAWARRR